jgi:gliding motility-associated protein GldM
VLKAFKLVDDSLHTTLSTTDSRNKVLMADFRAQRDDNPQKVGEWYNKATELTQRADSLFNFIQDVKCHIAIEADGPKKADPEGRTIVGNDNREAAARYALPNVGIQPGTILREMVEDYREFLISLDTARTAEFKKMFDTSSKMQKDGSSQSWEIQMFLDMPAGAAVTLMTKLQNDVRNAQNIMIQHLRRQTDAGDMRVNKMQAYVIPESKIVMRGSKYSARIVLAAIDSTKTPEYYVEGQRLSDQGLYEAVASKEGKKTYSGYISFMNPQSGEMENLLFNEEYMVIPPAVTISNTDLTVMYRDYANKFSVSVPGITDESKIKVVVEGAPAKKEGAVWVIKPTGAVKQVTIKVLAEVDGRTQEMGKEAYKVLDLPKPRAFFRYNTTTFNGEKPVARSVLTSPEAYIEAGYGPDVILQMDFDVVGFRARIRGMVSASNGPRFSADQLKRIKELDGGTVINLVDIQVRPKGGGNIQTLPPFPLELK